MVALPLFVGIFAIIEMSYKSILQTELDNKLFAVATDLGISAYDYDTATDFMTDHFCPEIGTTFLNCSKIDIGIDVLVNRPYTYRNNDFIGRWEMGCINDTILIELQYPVEDFVHSIAIADIIQRGGQKYYRSRGVIRREPRLSGGAAC